jgi:arginase
MRPVALFGVPSSAGAHFRGVENAPKALRAAGVRGDRECGDVTHEVFRPDNADRCARNSEAVVRVAQAVRDRTLSAFDRGDFVLVLGGECTISVGVTAAFVTANPDGALVYFDAQSDLNTPATSTSGILDSMALAHIVNEPGVVPELAALGPVPMLRPEDVVVFGANAREMNRAEIVALDRGAFTTFPLEVVRGNGASAAREAVHRFDAAKRPFLVHFDLDVVDFADLTLGNIPGFSPGLPFSDTVAALEVFVSNPLCAGLVITELNPDHDDAGRTQIDKFATALSRILRHRSQEER